MKFHDNFFYYILTLLVVIMVSASYVRFMVNQDYLVSFEGACNPTTENCFTGCEDDECTTQYYYSEVVKYAPDLYRECGPDITDCEAANVCLPDDRKCSVTYCDIEVDGDTCETLIEKPDAQSDNQVDPAKDGLLQSNNISNTNI